MKQSCSFCSSLNDSNQQLKWSWKIVYLLSIVLYHLYQTPAHTVSCEVYMWHYRIKHCLVVCRSGCDGFSLCPPPPQCFTCSTCRNRLVPGDRFHYINGSLFCEHDRPTALINGHLSSLQTNPLLPDQKVRPPTLLTPPSTLPPLCTSEICGRPLWCWRTLHSSLLVSFQSIIKRGVW